MCCGRCARGWSDWVSIIPVSSGLVWIPDWTYSSPGYRGHWKRRRAPWNLGATPFGNPITDAQVVGGLRKLIQTVCDPGYLSAMDLGHPGIKAPLKRCMDDLEALVQRMEGTPASVSPPPASKGVETLVSLCTELGILFPDPHVNQAVEELRREGELARAYLGRDATYTAAAAARDRVIRIA